MAFIISNTCRRSSLHTKVQHCLDDDYIYLNRNSVLHILFFSIALLCGHIECRLIGCRCVCGRFGVDGCGWEWLWMDTWIMVMHLPMHTDWRQTSKCWWVISRSYDLYTSEARRVGGLYNEPINQKRVFNTELNFKMTDFVH